MTDTQKVIDLKLVKLTLTELGTQQIIRLMAKPVDLPSPTPPEGYTHEQALANIESYKKEWSDRQATIQTIQMLREVGTARALALDKGLVTEEEKAQLARICARYAFTNPDTLDDTYQIGSVIYEMAIEFGDPIAIFEGNAWLRNRAGFISDEAVAEILKSLRREGQQPTDTGSSGADKPEEPKEEPATDNIV